MAEVVGQGIIELVGDARKLQASISEAKRSIRTLGEGQKDISKGASQSIDRYIGRLQTQNATIGKSVRETELFKLALRGASNEQLKSANAALKMAENQAKFAQSAQAVRGAFVAIAALAATGLLAAAVAFDTLVKKAGNFQDLSEKIGDTAENVASLAVAAQVGGVGMDAVVSSSAKLTKALTGVDDESKAAGAAIIALGLDLESFKKLPAADQIENIAQALAGFQDGTEKTAVAMALFGKSGQEMLPFLKELAGETGRQNILTTEQIRLADEYSDKQKRLTALIGLHAQAIATQMLPVYVDLQGAFLDLLKGISGVERGATSLASNTGIQDFARDAARWFAFVVDSGQGVVRMFQLIGNNIGANAAIQAALLRGEIKQALSIAADARQQMDDILNRPLFSTLLDQRTAAREGFVGPPSSAANKNAGKPKLNFSGAVPKAKSGADTAAAEAKAQLAFDLEQIKKASDATINAFSNQEKIMQALHSASLGGDKKYFHEKLADEGKYFADKRALLVANAAEQERAFKEEIARLEREKFTGKNAAKEQLDNARKIADVQGKMAKVRADSSAELAVLQIQEFSSAQKLVEENNKLARSYEDAKVASDDYIKSIVRRNEAEQQGVGRGTQFREIQSGRNDVEDKFTQRKQELNRDLRNNQITRETFDTYLRVAQETYSKEIILYDDRTEKMLAAQGDWVNGANEALQNYIDDSRNVAKQTEDIWTNSFKGAEDALVEFTKTGKLNFKSLVDSISADITRMSIKENITGPLAEWVKGGGGGLLGGVLNSQAPAPVETRSLAGAIAGTATGAAGAATADAAMIALSASTTVADAALVTLGATTPLADAALATLSASAAVADASLVTLGVTVPLADVALTTLAASAAAAASALATVGASSAVSGGSGIISAGVELLGSYADGINYVPKTGIYQLHKGESVTTASENKGGAMRSSVINIYITVPGTTDSRTQSQIATAAGQAVNRALARNA